MYSKRLSREQVYGADADWGVLHRGAHWRNLRILLNRPCAAVMRTYDKLL